MNNNIEKDLIQCLTMISADWEKQNNDYDKLTNFIYNADNLQKCLHLIEQNNADKEYALHRWYNYMTSVKCEYLFCEFGAVHEPDKYNHDVDIYIDNIPYDVKLTVYPVKLSNRPYDLKKRSGKNKMIEWYYANQSQQDRKQLINRLYVVCDGNSQYECLKMKSNFSLLRQKIGAFMQNTKTNGFNQLTITDNGTQHSVYSDLIYITCN